MLEAMRLRMDAVEDASMRTVAGARTIAVAVIVIGLGGIMTEVRIIVVLGRAEPFTVIDGACLSVMKNPHFEISRAARWLPFFLPQCDSGVGPGRASRFVFSADCGRSDTTPTIFGSIPGGSIQGSPGAWAKEAVSLRPGNGQLSNRTRLMRLTAAPLVQAKRGDQIKSSVDSTASSR
jgi:hypothetical protein